MISFAIIFEMVEITGFKWV